MTLPRSSKRRIFVSHSSQDRGFARRLTQVLQRHNITYWYGPAHIVGAKQWHDEIGKALAECNWFLLVLTPDAVRSKWVKRELLYALGENRYNEKIIPLLCKPCKYAKLSWTLGEFEFVEFAEGFEHGCTELLKIWGIEYKPEPVRRKPDGRTSRTRKKRR